MRITLSQLLDQIMAVSRSWKPNVQFHSPHVGKYIRTL